MISDRIPGLDELAFEGRNKDYGAYYFRKNYSRTLFISLVVGVVLLLIVVMSSWMYYYFEPALLVEGDLVYTVEYYNISPPPDDESDNLAQAYAKPVEEANLPPVVTDSIQEEKTREEPPVEKPEAEITNVDSAANPGGSGLGTGVGEDNGLASAIDVYPRYPGGDESRLKYLRRQVRYPEAALKAQIQGTVMIVFIVERDGSISNINVASRIGGGCDEEAIRVTKEMPRWEPGKQHGRAVRVMVRMPIVFRIPGKSTLPK